MKAVLVAINSKYIHSSLAVWYLKAATEKLCETRHDVEILEYTIHSDVGKIADEILGMKADLIGFSCYIWNIEKVNECIELIHEKTLMIDKHKKEFILLGGPEVSFNCSEALAETGADAVIAGEGEVAFSQLLDCLDLTKSDETSKIQGLYLKTAPDKPASPTGINDESCACPTVEPPTPYTDEYFEKLDARIVYFETSRGCPFSCAFCLSGQSRLRFFSLEKAKDQLARLAGTKATTIKFVDRTFNCYKKHSDELIKFMIDSANASDKLVAEKFSSKCFHLEVGADLFDDETIDLLGTAPFGLFQIEAGIQSYYAVALEACGRKSDLDKITYSLKKLINFGSIHVHVDLIAGLPFETYSQFTNSFNSAFALKPHMLQLGFLKLIHGSQLRNEVDCDNPHGYIFENDAPYEIISNKYITQTELKKLENVEYHLGQLYNSGRFVHTVETLIDTAKITPFELFDRLGTAIPHTHSVSLNEYLAQIFPILLKFENIDKVKLCNIIAEDYYCSVRNAKIPEFIETEKEQIQRVTKQVRHRKAKFNLAGMFKVYLSGDAESFYLVDYEEYNVVTRRYVLKKYNISEVLGR